MSDLPDYHFRIRENGAAVFRVGTANRQRRIEMEQIATVHLGKGEIRPQGARALTEEDLAEITRWIEARRALLARREKLGVDELLELGRHCASGSESQEMQAFGGCAKR